MSYLLHAHRLAWMKEKCNNSNELRIDDPKSREIDPDGWNRETSRFSYLFISMQGRASFIFLLSPCLYSAVALVSVQRQMWPNLVGANQSVTLNILVLGLIDVFKGVAGRESQTRRRGGGVSPEAEIFFGPIYYPTPRSHNRQSIYLKTLRSYPTKSPVDTIVTWQLRMKLFGLVEFLCSRWLCKMAKKAR